MNFNDFVNFTANHCSYNGIRFLVSDKASIPYAGTDSMCTGYFDDGTSTGQPTLAIAKGSPSAFGVLVHEYCHSTQFLDLSKVWVDIQPNSVEKELFGEYADDLFFSWIDGNIGPETHIFHIDRIMRQFNALVAVELDCEKRTVALIEALGIEIDPVEYTQKANSYVYMYQYFLKHRCFYRPGFEPYNIQAVWSQMPQDFDTLDYFAPITEKYERLFKEHCYA